jgi:hypothetical protein
MYSLLFLRISLFTGVYKKMPCVCKYIQSFTWVQSVKTSIESGYVYQQYVGTTMWKSTKKRGSLLFTSKAFLNCFVAHFRSTAVILSWCRVTRSLSIQGEFFSGFWDNGCDWGQNHAQNQGCQMVYLHAKNSNLGIFCKAFEWKMLVYSISIWYLYGYFCNVLYVFWGHLVYIFPLFGMLYQEKSGNPANHIHHATYVHNI